MKKRKGDVRMPTVTTITVREIIAEMDRVRGIIDRLNTMRDGESMDADDTNKILEILNGYYDRLMEATAYVPFPLSACMSACMD